MITVIVEFDMPDSFNDCPIGFKIQNPNMDAYFSACADSCGLTTKAMNLDFSCRRTLPQKCNQVNYGICIFQVKHEHAIL